MNAQARAVIQQALEACPFCGNTPSFSGDVTEWKDDARYVELSLGCCVSMTEAIGWRRAGAMTPEARTAELRSRLHSRWNTRVSQAQPVQEPVTKMTAHRAIYFMERFKREEKLLGPNEQAALDFVISMLEKQA